jgi:hypothetical protein
MLIKEFADRLFKADIEYWEKGNPNALDAFEDPDVVFHMPSQDRVGRDKQALLGMRQHVTDLRIEMKYLAGEGNLFAATWKAHFIRTRENPDRPETIGKVGKEGTVDALMVFRLENGKIVEVWDWPRPTVYS